MYVYHNIGRCFLHRPRKADGGLTWARCEDYTSVAYRLQRQKSAETFDFQVVAVRQMQDASKNTWLFQLTRMYNEWSKSQPATLQQI